MRAYYDIHDDALSVSIDSGSVAIPGVGGPDAPPLMSKLYVTAIVAAVDTSSLSAVNQPRGGRAPDLRGWRPVATSDSSLLVDELHYGETRAVSNLRFRVANVPAGNRDSLWVVLRIAGNTVDIRPPATPGGPVRRADFPGGVLVYACGARSLGGNLDASRARALRRAYGIAC